MRIGAVTAIAVATVGLAVPVRSQAPQVFRSVTDAVVVDVSVNRGGVPVSKLGVGDFQLLDNGVPQAVELSSSGPIPLDVCLLLDTGTLGTRNPLRFWHDVSTINSLLRSGDRLSLTTFASTSRDEFRLSSVPVNIPPHPTSTGLTVPVDALVQAMLRPGVPGRRHVIIEVAGGWGLDVSLPVRVRGVASRCDALVYVVVDGRANPSLVEAAKLTGGSVLNDRDLVAGVKRILQSLAGGYVLTYSATNVERSGWHEITVKVVSPGGAKYSVRARRGYVRE